MASLAAAIRSMYDLGAQLTASWNQLCAGFICNILDILVFNISLYFIILYCFRLVMYF